MIDPSIIDAKIAAAQARDGSCTSKLLNEIARLPVIAPWQENTRAFSLDVLNTQLKPGRFADSGLPSGAFPQVPDNGSYANQLYSAICFMVDARVELKLLELIASPDFYSALMRSAGEIPA